MCVRCCFPQHGTDSTTPQSEDKAGRRGQRGRGQGEGGREGGDREGGGREEGGAVHLGGSPVLESSGSSVQVCLELPNRVASVTGLINNFIPKSLSLMNCPKLAANSVS